MIITKKVVSIVLAVMMVAAMMSVMAVSASAATVSVSTAAELRDAVAAASSGDTIKLAADVDFTDLTTNRNAHDSGEEIKLDLKDCTLDLNGNTITSVNASVVYTGNGAVIQNGSFRLNHVKKGGTGYQAGSYGICLDGYGVANSITLNDLDIEGGVNIWGANVEINNVSAATTASKFYAVWAEDDSNVVINSGTFTDNQSGGKGVIATGTGEESGSSITVNGGTFTGDNKLVYNTETGAITINGGSFDGAVVESEVSSYIPAGKDTVVKDGVTYVAAEGTDGVITTAAELVAAADIGGNWILGNDISLTTPLTISGESAKYGAYITKDFVLDGANHTITSTVARAIGVKGSESDLSNVTIKNVTIQNSQAGAICVITRGNIDTLTLDNVKLDTQGCPSGYNQPLTIGGTQYTQAKVNVINGSVIQTNNEASKYYAIILWNPVDLTIQDSTIKGWACVYQKQFEDGTVDETEVTIDNSTLISKGLKGSSNHFAAIMTEEDGFSCVVTNSTIDVTAAENTYQGIVASNGSSSGFEVELGAGNNVTMTGDTAIIGFNFDEVDHEISVSGGTFNKPVDEYYCAAGFIGANNNNGTYGVAVDTNPLNGVAQIVGYQNKAAQADAEGDGVRILTKVDNTKLADFTEYGYVVAKVGAKKGDGVTDLTQANADFSMLTADGGNGQKVIDCTGTYNNGIDGVDNTYVTLAVNGMSDGDRVAVRFYAIDNDGTYYSYYVGTTRYNGIIAAYTA